jgi:hypothetical protein
MGQTDQFGVGQATLCGQGWPGAAVGPQQLSNSNVQCDDEVVETGAHEAPLEVDVAQAMPTLGGLVSASPLDDLAPI